ncbi:MAG: NUDIX domain-containing protein [Acholeplasmatales bacterium]|nr:NUDIX domain-containing protein [Acholeplasmatales bacterium]
MRLLGKNDKHDYKRGSRIIRRIGVRAIIIEDNKIYLSYSSRNKFYKLPGGGVNKGESIIEALKRETLEEVGIDILNKSIKRYGLYIDKWRSVRLNDGDAIWLQKSFCFICKRYGELKDIMPTDSEIYDQSERRFVSIDEAISTNEARMKSIEYSNKERFLERDTEILKLIKKELIENTKKRKN